jgi:hypothetical protein
MQTKYSHGQPVLAAVVMLAVMTLACSIFAIPPLNAATPTPTGQINAVEATPSASAADKKNWQLWEGTIASQTSRQFTSNGSTVNTCKTGWDTNFLFTVDTAGDVNGVGFAKLSSGPDCSPHSITGNTSEMTMSVKGRKDQTAFYLNLGAIDFKPKPSGDFGGFELLVTNGACPPTMATLKIPLTGSGSAQAKLDLSGILTGCGGSKDDVMSNQSQVDLKYRFKCGEDPLGPSDPDIQGICQ